MMARTEGGRASGRLLPPLRGTEPEEILLVEGERMHGVYARIGAETLEQVFLGMRAGRRNEHHSEPQGQDETRRSHSSIR